MTAKVFGYKYAGKPNGQPYELWREEFGREWLAADFSPIESDYVVSEFTASQHSFIALGNMRGSPLHMDRRNDLAENLCNHLFLIVASGCNMRASQHGRSIELSREDMTLLSANEPARLTQLTAGDRWSIRIPHRLLADLCKNVEDKIARPIARSELTKLLLHQIETAHRFGPTLDATAAHATGQYVLDLVVLCLGTDRDATHIAKHRGLASARLDSIKAEILRCLSRSNLGLAHIAAGPGLSKRYVQHLFERSGMSYTSFVLEQRLLLAHRLLRDPKHRSRKISDIAAVSGFSDISYFNRAFRGQFKATPKDIRANLDQRAPSR
jgi:AraC-like DNA-binding protein